MPLKAHAVPVTSRGGIQMKSYLYASTACIATALLIGLATPALAQDQTPADADDIIVTARRIDERLQDVPISVTVFSQEQLAKHNIVGTSDLVNYTPSLSSNNRFGSDNASYAIRGFTQELRTTASVGMFFADVVAQRAGQTSVTSGDGAGPGAFFDLENVQVLKGPQGTLFGRNTTGGAVMLVPRKPTGRFEGYVEGSAGNYGMYRIQGVLNVPLGEHARLRIGIDHNKRDGYQHVISGLGPDRLGKVGYVSGRASLVVDLGESIENYTIGSFAKSRGNSLIESLFICAPVPAPSPPGPFARNGIAILVATACADQLAAHPPGFYDASSRVPDPISRINSWQVINTTTFTVSDNFTVKNIFAYGEMDTRLRSALFGTDYRIPAFNPLTNAPSVNAGQPFIFANVNPNAGDKMTDQRNVVEELRFSGKAGGDKLDWQAGFYYERSTPKSFVGNTANLLVSCPNGGDQNLDPTQFLCQDVIRPWVFMGFAPIGSISVAKMNIAYRNVAVYGQATYKFSNQFSVTGGLRYTWDTTDAEVSQIRYSSFPTLTVGPAGAARCEKSGSPGHPVSLATGCLQSFTQKSKAPTWLIDFGYRPAEDILLYASYKRGYRQGSVIPVAPDRFETYKPEKVDTYEIGAKMTFRGALRGYFNIAGFYNKLTDQQIQVGVNSSTGAAAQTIIIANAGRSTIKGFEVDARIMPVEGLSINLGYTYLDTRLHEIIAPDLSGTLYDTIFNTVNVGGPLTFAPKHKLVLSGSYKLPLPESIGDVSVGATYVYTSSQVATAASILATMPGFDLVNLNVSWNKIAGGPVDASLFVTNLFEKHYANFIGGTFNSFGGEMRIPGEPRMIGARVRFNFGN